MYKNHRIAVVVPCRDEEAALGRVLDTMPAFVDEIIVVDDASRDASRETALSRMERDRRITLLFHDEARGVGGALATGYRHALAGGAGIAAVMAGDGQMAPDVLASILDPVAEGRADFSKGDRLRTSASRSRIPALRLAGNFVLSFFTGVLCGRRISDSQNGFTALNRRVLETIDWDRLYRRYGQPNDLLVKVCAAGFTVAEVPHEAVYFRERRSKLKPLGVVFPIAWLLVRHGAAKWLRPAALARHAAAAQAR